MHQALHLGPVVEHSVPAVKVVAGREAVAVVEARWAEAVMAVVARVAAAADSVVPVVNLGWVEATQGLMQAQAEAGLAEEATVGAGLVGAVWVVVATVAAE